MSIREKMAKQIRLERESAGLGQTRYSGEVLPWRTSSRQDHEEAETTPGKRLLHDCIRPTADAIRAHLKAQGRPSAAAEYLEVIEPEAAAYLIARTLINSKHEGLTANSIAVADALLQHLGLVAHAVVNSDSNRALQKRQRRNGGNRHRKAAISAALKADRVNIDLPAHKRAAIGAICITLIIDATGFWQIETVRKPGSRHNSNGVKMTEELRQRLLEQHSRCALLDPVDYTDAQILS